jgi:hypothetical protein
MSQVEPRGAARSVVDEVRAARAAVAEQAGGLAGLGDYLARVELEFRTRSGRFADVPAQRPADLQRLIDAAETDDPLLDEIRALRTDIPEEETSAPR